MRHMVDRIGLRTLLYTVLAFGCLLAVAIGLGLTFPAAGLPFALNAAGTTGAAAPRPTSQLERPGADAVSTTGCSKAPPASPGASAPESLRVGALERRYRLHVPLAYQAGALTPLVLGFHGHGSTDSLFERSTRLSQLADLNRFIAVYPQGVVGPDGATGWNTGRAQDPTVDDLQFVDTLLTHLQGELCVDPQRIYATGFSNGGGMTAVLACVFADRIAAFAPVAGDYYPQPGGCHPARPVPILEIHGALDTIIPYGGSARLRYPAVNAWLSDWAWRDGCLASPTSASLQPGVTEMVWSDCQGGAVVAHYRLDHAGHVWPSTAGDPAAARHDALDGGAAVWAFLERFALPVSDASA